MKKAFTLAEVLITLSVIGIIAAITLPSLTSNIQDKIMETQRQALYTRLSQAVSQMYKLNGYGSYEKIKNEETGTTDVTDTSAESFLIALSKVYKIKNICNSKTPGDCDFPTSYTSMWGTAVSASTNLYNLNTDGTSYLKNTKTAYFKTENGESLLLFYNPDCVEGDISTIGSGHVKTYMTYMCANFIYDLNGAKKPNQYGKDIGHITVFYAKSPNVVAPMILSSNVNGKYPFYSENETGSAAYACRNFDSDSRLPDIYEMMSMHINSGLYGVSSGFYSGMFLTSTVTSAGESGKVYVEWIRTGANFGPVLVSKSTGYTIRCIKK